MTLVTSICDYIYVMDFGYQIFDGTPAEVVASPLVQAAYLGDVIPDLVSDENTAVGDPA